MAKSKYESHVEPRLEEVKDWVRNGATDQEIALRLSISLASYYEYQKRYPEFLESLKETKDYSDAQVESALHEAAMKGNVTAQIFWLKNRRTKAWREQATVETEDGRAQLERLCKTIEGVVKP